MKYLKQFLIILLVSCIGELLYHLLPLPIPATIYGLVLMLGLLMLKIVPLNAVKETAEFLIEIMPVMFIPAGVGLIIYWPQLKEFLIFVTISNLLLIFQINYTLLKFECQDLRAYFMCHISVYFI